MAIFNLDQAKEHLRTKPRFKRFVLRLLMPCREARPRRWVRVSGLPFVIKTGSRVVFGKDIRRDILPPVAGKELEVKAAFGGEISAGADYGTIGVKSIEPSEIDPETLNKKAQP